MGERQLAGTVSGAGPTVVDQLVADSRLDVIRADPSAGQPRLPMNAVSLAIVTV